MSNSPDSHQPPARARFQLTDEEREHIRSHLRDPRLPDRDESPATLFVQEGFALIIHPVHGEIARGKVISTSEFPVITIERESDQHHAQYPLDFAREYPSHLRPSQPSQIPAYSVTMMADGYLAFRAAPESEPDKEIPIFRQLQRKYNTRSSRTQLPLSLPLSPSLSHSHAILTEQAEQSVQAYFEAYPHLKHIADKGLTQMQEDDDHDSF